MVQMCTRDDSGMGPATRAGPAGAVAGVGRVCSAARAWCWAGAVAPLAAGLTQMRWCRCSRVELFRPRWWPGKHACIVHRRCAVAEYGLVADGASQLAVAHALEWVPYGLSRQVGSRCIGS